MSKPEPELAFHPLCAEFRRQRQKGSGEPTQQTNDERTQSNVYDQRRYHSNIPSIEFENIAQEIVSELEDRLGIHVADEDLTEALKIIRQQLQWMADRTLWALEPITIIADPDDPEA
jgi:hypothetical protein